MFLKFHVGLFVCMADTYMYRWTILILLSVEDWEQGKIASLAFYRYNKILLYQYLLKIMY